MTAPALSADGLEHRRIAVDYTPTERQRVAHTTYADEVLYGGAAGGGKSRFIRMEALTFALEVPGVAVLILRQSYPDLTQAGGIIPMLLEEVPKEVGTYNATEHVWKLRNGSTIRMAQLPRDADVTKYQGAEYQLIIFDEGTQFSEYRFRYMLSRLRCSGALRDRMAAKGYRPRVIITANPGGIGHAWVKARFIDPAPPGVVWRPTATLEDPEPGTRCFIPAKVTDNPHLDSSYMRQLNRLDEETRRMLRDGEWDVYAGQAFPTFRRSVHVIDPEDLPLPLGGIRRAIGVDYGLSAPFAALWGAQLADGLVVVYRELYAPELTPAEQADRIVAAEAPGERAPGRAATLALDPSTWARNPHAPKATAPKGGVRAGVGNADRPPAGSIAASYRDVLGGAVRKAQNDRRAGVALLREKLRVRDDGLPRVLIYSTCRNLVRTLPTLPRDKHDPEDIDTHAEDHAYDALRYLLMELERGGGAVAAPATPNRHEPQTPVAGGPAARRRPRPPEIASALPPTATSELLGSSWT